MTRTSLLITQYYIKRYSKYIALFALVAVLGLSFSILLSLPKSEPELIYGLVIAKGTNQGEESSGERLTVETETGRIVTLTTYHQVGGRVGDRVMLNTYERYVFSPKYQFVKIVRN